MMYKKEDLYFFLDIEVEELFNLADRFSHIPGTIFLFSGSELDSSKRSFLWAFPFDTIFCTAGILSHRGSRTWSYDIWQTLKSKVQNHSWAGFLGYEMGFPTNALSAIDTHDAYLQRSCFEAIYDHASKTLQVSIDRQHQELLSEPNHSMCQNVTEKSLQEILKKSMKEPRGFCSLHVTKPFESYELFAEKLERIQEAILRGDVYQLNLSHEISFSGRLRPWGLFRQLVNKNQLSFFAYIKLEKYSIVSASPERFLQRKKMRLETRPIKGTRPRGHSIEEDALLLESLVKSEKESSELVMIVDLMRNDLSKVSESGSVEVKELFRIETYRHLFHRLAIIQSQSKPLHPIDILKETFPGGSVTGCPKLSAMKLISELEQRRRGLYTGSIGYIRDNGDFDFSIAIRTAVCTPRQISFAVGGGIVIDSEAKSEYLETKYKAESLLEILNVSEREL